MRKVIYGVVVLLVLGGAILIFIRNRKSGSMEGKIKLNMTLSSPAFKEGGMIPKKYTCKGEDINPELEIGDVPEKTKSLVLIVDDPDAPVGTWTHWIVFNIPPNVRKIKENSVPDGVRLGFNDFQRTKYGGPCPPSGTHRYFFKIYALDTVLPLKEGAKREECERAMKGHIIGMGKLMGRFSKD